MIAAILLTACGASAEQIATMTASAWTPTPVLPTDHALAHENGRLNACWAALAFNKYAAKRVWTNH